MTVSTDSLLEHLARQSVDLGAVFSDDVKFIAPLVEPELSARFLSVKFTEKALKNSTASEVAIMLESKPYCPAGMRYQPSLKVKEMYFEVATLVMNSVGSHLLKKFGNGEIWHVGGPRDLFGRYTFKQDSEYSVRYRIRVNLLICTPNAS